MKKILLVLLLAAVLTTGTAFASPVHPDGLGIGVVWRGNMWGGGHWGTGHGAALSLKLPGSPIFWGIGASGGGNGFSVGVTGDRYFAGSALIPTLGWYLGLGGFISFSTSGSGDNSAAHLGFGARLPIGLTWQPITIFELFANFAPSLGASVRTGGSSNDGRFYFPTWGVPIEIGLRLWI